MIRLTLLLSLTLIFGGCASVNYSGEHHPPVDDAIVVDERSELGSGYRPIGRAVATVPAGLSGLVLRSALEEKAEEVGAHAVVVGETREVVTGGHFHWHYYEPYGPTYADWNAWPSSQWMGRPLYPGWYGRTYHFERDLELRALFLRREEDQSEDTLTK